MEDETSDEVINASVTLEIEIPAIKEWILNQDLNYDMNGERKTYHLIRYIQHFCYDELVMEEWPDDEQFLAPVIYDAKGERIPWAGMTAGECDEGTHCAVLFEPLECSDDTLRVGIVKYTSQTEYEKVSDMLEIPISSSTLR